MSAKSTTSTPSRDQVTPNPHPRSKPGSGQARVARPERILNLYLSNSRSTGSPASADPGAPTTTEPGARPTLPGRRHAGSAGVAAGRKNGSTQPSPQPASNQKKPNQCFT